MGMFNDTRKFPENTSFSKYIKNDIFLLNKTQVTTYSILVGSMTVFDGEIIPYFDWNQHDTKLCYVKSLHFR